MLSTSIFSSNGSVYDQLAVFGTTFQLNQTALNEVGLPHMTGSNVWTNITDNLAVGTVIDFYGGFGLIKTDQIGGLFAHCVCFWGPYLRDTFRNARLGRQQDLHWKVRKFNLLHRHFTTCFPGNAEVQRSTNLVVSVPTCSVVRWW